MRIALCALAVGVAALGPSMLAQSGGTSSTGTNNGNVVRGAMGFPGRATYHGTPVVGAPFSAERVSEHVQIGADGTRFTTTNQQETIYRDSEGRTRTERPATVGPNPQPVDAPMIVDIEDPVGNVSYTLDVQHKAAHRVAWPAAAESRPAGTAASAARSGPLLSSNGVATASISAAMPAPPPPPAAGGALVNVITTWPVPSRVAANTGASANHPEVRNEDLGQQVIEGVAAEGHRTVQTWPAGAVGNDRPFQVVSENWYSAEIKETVLSTNSDPRSGENTTKLINIGRSEPDASLFMPPADYTVVDETGPFQIQWTGTKQ
jgi:hypothetical protein